MLAVSDVEVTREAANGLHADAEYPTRALATGDVLFQTGDTHAQLYRVESGAICHYIGWDDGSHEIIEFAFPGDIIGFGHLEAHISTARAVVATTVSLVSEQDFQRALETDGQLAARYAAASDREFDHLRARAIKMGHGKPLVLARLVARRPVAHERA